MLNDPFHHVLRMFLLREARKENTRSTSSFHVLSLIRQDLLMRFPRICDELRTLGIFCTTTQSAEESYSLSHRHSFVFLSVQNKDGGFDTLDMSDRTSTYIGALI